MATADRVKPGKELLVRIVAMLSKLVERFDSDQYRVRESPLDSNLPFEDENEDGTIRKAIRRHADTLFPPLDPHSGMCHSSLFQQSYI